MGRPSWHCRRRVPHLQGGSQAMRPKERIAAAFEGGATDRVPVHHIGACSQVATALLGREAYVGGGIQQFREAVAWWQGEQAHADFVERSFQDALAVARLFEDDVIRPSYWRYNVKPTKRLDENTFLYEYGEESQWQVLRFDPPSEQCNTFPYAPQREATFEEIERQIEAQEKAIGDHRPSEQSFEFEIRAQRLLGREYAVRVGGVGVSLPITESSIWFEALLLRPDLCARHLDLQVARACCNVAFLAERGFRYFFGGGDFASNQGPMYSPRHFRELVAPRLKQVSDICHQHGGYHLFASDGDLWPVADELFRDAEIDGFYEIDRRAGMDLRRLHDRYPRLTLIGNISSHTLHLGAREEIVREVEEAVGEAKRFGRTVVGISNYFVPGTPVSNVELVLETIRRLRSLLNHGLLP